MTDLIVVPRTFGGERERLVYAPLFNLVSEKTLWKAVANSRRNSS